MAEGAVVEAAEEVVISLVIKILYENHFQDAEEVVVDAAVAEVAVVEVAAEAGEAAAVAGEAAAVVAAVAAEEVSPVARQSTSLCGQLNPVAAADTHSRLRPATRNHHRAATLLHPAGDMRAATLAAAMRNNHFPGPPMCKFRPPLPTHSPAAAMPAEATKEPEEEAVDIRRHQAVTKRRPAVDTKHHRADIRLHLLVDIRLHLLVDISREEEAAVAEATQVAVRRLPVEHLPSKLQPHRHPVNKVECRVHR